MQVPNNSTQGMIIWFMWTLYVISEYLDLFDFMFSVSILYCGIILNPINCISRVIVSA